MRARRPRFYNLRKPRVRQSWNKFNLYNIARGDFLNPRRLQRTFFQQKWAAKRLTRGYHGAHISETDWSRMFSRRLLSSVDLDPSYLATHDGSEQSSGRGSGRQLDPASDERPITASQFSRAEPAWMRNHDEKIQADRFSHFKVRSTVQNKQNQILAKPTTRMTPYMQMTFAPLERRLDVAIFRAMFASSTLQARQFCVHGAVKVNGKKMRYPAYRLNPGDMFQVDPERVLFAAGEPKNPQETARVARMLAQQEEREAAREAKARAEQAAKQKQLADKISAGQRGGGDAPGAEASEQAAGDTAVEVETQEAVEVAAAEGAERAEAIVEDEAKEGMGEDGEPLTPEELQAQHKRQLKGLIQDAKRLLKDKDEMGVKQKQRVRLFLGEAKRALSRLGKQSGAIAEDVNLDDAAVSRDAVMDHLAAILKGLSLDQQQAQREEAAAEAAQDEADASTPSVREQIETLSPEEQKALATLLREDAENPVDETKPYLTPWRPRKYLSPFAFIPRYLEVNQNICAAVYLRHPVARRGLAEVPTPFPYETSQLAFNWYLRRH